MTHGALATAGEDQVPLGTYASYVLDSQGQPILRLREEAVHTANLLRNPQCSLFVQPDDMPARILARATLIGKVSLHIPPAHGSALKSLGNLTCPLEQQVCVSVRKQASLLIHTSVTSAAWTGHVRQGCTITLHSDGIRQYDYRTPPHLSDA